MMLAVHCLICFCHSSTQDRPVCDCCAGLIAQTIWIGSLSFTCILFSINRTDKCLITLFFGFELSGYCLFHLGSHFAPMLTVAGLNCSEGMLDFLLSQVVLLFQQWQHSLQCCICCSDSIVHLIWGLCDNGAFCEGVGNVLHRFQQLICISHFGALLANQ
jgi:hypothetical protein